jgi:hypothetical protein
MKTLLTFFTSPAFVGNAGGYVTSFGAVVLAVVLVVALIKAPIIFMGGISWKALAALAKR